MRVSLARSGELHAATAPRRSAEDDATDEIFSTAKVQLSRIVDDCLADAPSAKFGRQKILGEMAGVGELAGMLHKAPVPQWDRQRLRGTASCRGAILQQEPKCASE